MLSKKVLKRREWKDSLYSNLMQHSILRILDKYIDDGLVLDIGGNTGYQTYFHSQFNRVVTYEPVPELFEVLKENLRKLDNVTFINKAVGSYCGNVTLYVDVNRLSNTSQVALVESQEIVAPIVTIDSEQHENVSFIKVDVEGFELEVLQGAEQTIKRDKPTCMVEIYEPWCKQLDVPAEQYFEFFEKLGYVSYYYNREAVTLVKCNTIEESVYAVKNLHHLHDADFLFIHKDRYESLLSKT